MGTNFYLNYPNRDYNEEHVGKRSAAGLYCWDCGVTLHKGGINEIHGARQDWHVVCPKCGKHHEREENGRGAANRELGFDKTPPAPKTGVKSCASFRWDMTPEEVKEKAEGLQLAGIVPIVSEYYDEYSWDEFHEVLSECPVQYFEDIGRGFS